MFSDRPEDTFVEGVRHAPFEIARVFYMYDVPGGATRGGHAHKDLQQLIVAISGSFEVVLDDGTTVRSDRFTVALCTCRRSRTYPWCDTSHRRRASRARTRTR